ncbi:long-chain acyl-CoA synthetase [Sediminihabitans luteus]|uniref:Acyl-CoA synthetase n=1 Tax=Sediminihabitans luteus TaxID=1138585 RepID=A0A2M9CY87_9CELL|nr:AMP-dependent synthetase/ligase [Sediminihabitans luteus]PJJ76813.1 long-chain acyl-CoA synthetase [Sediminihabitans luteus]GIJ00291.1 long-chain-fatty-acid--CoA ligase [Sediminihabitans luteus]
MQRSESPTLVEVDARTTIPSLLSARVERSADLPLVERRGPDGTWEPVTAREFADDVAAVARGFLARGLEKGDRVAIMSRTRYEWMLLDFAAWAAGLVPVPVYETSSPEQVRWILEDSGTRLAVTETAAHAATVAAVRDALPSLEDVLVLDDGALEALRSAGTAVTASALEARRDACQRDDVATIIYTSGSTGRPKGAELTHGNFVHLALNGVEGLAEIVAPAGARTLLFLPLAHVFARYIQVMAVASPSVIGHSPDTKDLLADLSTFRPTYLLAVPRIFEKVYAGAERKAGGGTRGKVFAWAAEASRAYSRATSAGRASFGVRARHAVAGRLVLQTLRDALGGQATYAISGGAPLGEDLGHFFRGAGLTILEGYGLTETTAPTAVNRPGSTRVGTVGTAFPGTSIRIADDGEIQVRGAHVFHGYRNQPGLTAEVFDDGWFRTGDLGTIDDDGFVRIVGRKKEIIVTAGGKNVAPAPLEDRLRTHPLVSQAVVVGDQQPFVGALVTLDAEGLEHWTTTRGRAPLSLAEAATDPDVLAEVDRAMATANEIVSRAESIRKVTVLPLDFTEENGYLTPSLKVRRPIVLDAFADEIAALYGTPRA